MERADALIVGGGPAGSACAGVLTAAGRDVLVVDAAKFPRDKPCGGWITPEALEEIPFSFDSYAEDHVAQPISKFRVGRIGGRAVDVDYGSPVSYGIRRSEFDACLLQQSGARLVEGERVKTIERRNGDWVLNGKFAAPVLVGAGGHFCPVARHVSAPAADEQPVVAAREIEFCLSEEEASLCEIERERPELYFCADLRGYGWCFRKENYLNVGLGRLDAAHLPAHVDAFLDFLKRERRLRVRDTGWRGHAYALYHGPPRRVSSDSVVLVGDAAGLAAPASGEGILPALISGRLAAESILESRPSDYASRLDERLRPRAPARRLPDRVAGFLGAALLASRSFARYVVLDRWFLHRTG